MAQETFDKVIDTEIGGSPICEAVKQLAGTLFEAVKPEYENDIYTEELEGGDELDSSMSTDADQMQDKYGTPMSVVDAKNVVDIHPEDVEETISSDAADDSVDDVLADLAPYAKTDKVSDADKELIVEAVANRLVPFFASEEWEDPDAKESTIQEYLNYFKCSYDDFLTVKSYINDHSVKELSDAMFDFLKLRIRTLPVTIQLSVPKNKAWLHRKKELIAPNNNVKTLTIHAPALLISRASDENSYIFLDRIENALMALLTRKDMKTNVTIGNEKIGSSTMTAIEPEDVGLEPRDLNLYAFIFTCIVPNLARVIEPEEPEVQEDDEEYDDRMSPGNRTPEDAYTDFEETRERSAYESVGTKLPGDIYNPALIEAVDHISEALFEG